MKYVFTVITGLIFGIGLAISGMMNPAKVLNFFDLAGSWDPSLAFVMGGAVIVVFLGYRLVWRRPAPHYAPAFDVPSSKTIDKRLVGGSALFGSGWAIAGFCPGPAVAAIGTGNLEVVLFVATSIGGMVLHRFILPSAN